MKKGNKYIAFNNYIIRTPLLSFSDVDNLTSEKIKELCKRDYISEAIYIASPELHTEMQKVLNGTKIKDEKKLIHTLLKYLLRMGNRCTPFGLFSGCALGKFSDEGNIQLDPIKSHKRLTRLDMNFLCALAQNIEKDKENRYRLLYYKNSSLYKIGDRLRYVEYRYEKTFRRHFTVSIDFSDFIEHIINITKDGVKIKEIATEIVKLDDEIPYQAAEEFVHELIDSQVIISSISPSVTGNGYLNVLSEAELNETIKESLSNVNDVLSTINSKPVGEGFSFYDQLITSITPLNTSYNKKFLLQTDLNISYTENKISKSVAKKASIAVAFLNKLNSVNQNRDLKKFKDQFYKRYEDEEIPLSIALDVESGLGYPVNKNASFDISPLIDDLNMFMRNINDSSDFREIKWSKRDELLNKKLTEFNWQNELEINLTDDDVKNFEENWENLPDTFSAMVNVLESDTNEELIHFDYAGGATATYLLGRFCHLNNNIDRFVSEIVEKEEQDDKVIHAEILHLPENRVGNILYRPQIRDYEIPYLAKSNLSSSNQIYLDDIMISVKNEEIVLRSKAMDKRIFPKMATAHNYSDNSLPVYHFLCDMQYQNIRNSISFTWGNLHQMYSKFPRISYKGIILSLATWKIDKKTIDKFFKDKTYLSQWLEQQQVPSRVFLKENDNELPINFNHQLSVEMFLSTIKNKSQVILTENLFNKNKALVKQKEKPFTNELIIAFHKSNL